MSTWYVRDRGHEMGPFSVQQLRDMRAKRQLHGYHEVSQDRRTWQAADLVPGLLEAAPPPPLQPVGTSPESFASAVPRAAARARITNRRVIAAVVAVIVLLSATGAYLVYRGSASSLVDGAIAFSGGTSETDRYQVYRESVCLVVPGRVTTFADGSRKESNYFPKRTNSVWTGRSSIEYEGGTGSGFLISTAGHILTNRHVVEEYANYMRSNFRKFYETSVVAEDKPALWVFFGRDIKIKAELLYQSEDYDFAILKIDPDARIGKRYFALCSTPVNEIPTIENLIAVGFPGKDRDPVGVKDIRDAVARDGLYHAAIQHAFKTDDFEPSKRLGSVTKKVELKQMTEGERECYILRHAAQIYGGNSGGPLLCRDGTVLGINTWGKREPGLNFALTLPQLRPELDKRVPNLVWRTISEGK